MRAALAHVIGDVLQSLGVCLSAALIWAFNDRWLDENGISYWYRSDPICTFLFSILVLWSTTGTIKEAVHVLMAGVPRGVDPSAVLAQLYAIPTVVEVHDLHVWTLVGSKRNMWAHIMVEPGADSTPVILAAQRVARAHNCVHTCFQVEDSGSSLGSNHWNRACPYGPASFASATCSKGPTTSPSKAHAATSRERERRWLRAPPTLLVQQAAQRQDKFRGSAGLLPLGLLV